MHFHCDQNKERNCLWSYKNCIYRLYTYSKKSFLFAPNSNFQLIANFSNSIKIHCIAIVFSNIHSCLICIAFFKNELNERKNSILFSLVGRCLKRNEATASHSNWSYWKMSFYMQCFIHCMHACTSIFWWMMMNVRNKISERRRGSTQNEKKTCFQVDFFPSNSICIKSLKRLTMTSRIFIHFFLFSLKNCNSDGIM